VEQRLQTMESNLQVAVMGCVVNGPGEAREADIGIAGGHGVGIVFKKGEIYKKVPEADLLPVFLEELERLEAERKTKA
jgi:(E)-4-hydroxy-3-methylbut-2-enyl-diphosphate synthase